MCTSYSLKLYAKWRSSKYIFYSFGTEQQSMHVHAMYKIQRKQHVLYKTSNVIYGFLFLIRQCYTWDNTNRTNYSTKVTSIYSKINHIRNTVVAIVDLLINTKFQFLDKKSFSIFIIKTKLHDLLATMRRLY